MLHCYTISQDSLQEIPVAEARPEKTVWIDLLFPTLEEEEFVEKLLRTDVPTRDEMHEIELSSRLFIEKEALYATVILIHKADTDEPQSRNATFMFKDNFLVTVRYCDPQPFSTFCAWASRENIAHYKSVTIFAGLAEAIIGRAADIIENTGRTVDQLTKTIFRPQLQEKNARNRTTPDFDDMLRRIGICGDLLSRTQESLVSMTRTLTYIEETPWFPAVSEEHARIKTVLRDIHALHEQVTFLSNKVFFLLDAVLGMTAIDQNRIIKIFSVVAVAFLPPTLIASIYGMNFRFLPELSWAAGYPLALTAMVLSAAVPLMIFRKKGWL